MGQQNRSPEVIDAEFEIVRPADPTPEERLRTGRRPALFINLPRAASRWRQIHSTAWPLYCAAYFVVLGCMAAGWIPWP